MNKRSLVADIISIIVYCILAGCGNHTDSSALSDKPKDEAVAAAEQEREKPDISENEEDKAEKKTLAQRMAGKYSYHASEEDGEEEYYTMDVVMFGDNLYAFCGQAFSDDDESLEAYTFWATEFIPFDADEMRSAAGDTVKVNELNFH